MNKTLDFILEHVACTRNSCVMVVDDNARLRSDSRNHHSYLNMEQLTNLSVSPCSPSSERKISRWDACASPSKLPFISNESPRKPTRSSNPDPVDEDMKVTNKGSPRLPQRACSSRCLPEPPYWPLNSRLIIYGTMDRPRIFAEYSALTLSHHIGEHLLVSFNSMRIQRL